MNCRGSCCLLGWLMVVYVVLVEVSVMGDNCTLLKNKVTSSGISFVNCFSSKTTIYSTCHGCSSYFDILFSNYNQLLSVTDCNNAAMMDSKFVDSLKAAQQAINTYQCWMRRTECYNDASATYHPLCKPNAILRKHSLQAGALADSRCLGAIHSSCEAYPHQPFCKYKLSSSSNGVVKVSAENTTTSIHAVSLYSVMCSPTSPYSTTVRNIPEAHAELYIWDHAENERSKLPKSWVNGEVSTSALGVLAKCTSGFLCDDPFILKEAFPQQSMPHGTRFCPGGMYCKNPYASLKELQTSYAFYVGNQCGGECSGLSGNSPTHGVCQSCRQSNVPFCLCSRGSYCAANSTFRFEEYPDCLRCPAGYFCPSFGAGFPIICPSGHHCPEGSWAPTECEKLSYCPTGSTRYYDLSWLLILPLCIFLIILAIRLIDRYSRRSIYFKAAEEGIEMTDAVSVKVPNREPSGVVDVTFNDLGVVLPNGTTILAGVTGTARHSTFTAILGPSGAGKTTFLNVLAGKITRTSGQVIFNGKEASISKYRKIIGYVPQDDIMLSELTVHEVLMHSANMRLARDPLWPASRRRSHVDETINLLGLKDQRSSRIGDEIRRGISGGQRKRVNIGIELCANPTLLFLDEPTSGLDSTSSEEVCDILGNIAARGVTVIAVIHQPRLEIFSKFNELLLLGVGGRVAYQGPPSEGTEYFLKLGFVLPEGVSEPDFMLDVTSGKCYRQGHDSFSPSELFEEWEQRKILKDVSDADIVEKNYERRNSCIIESTKRPTAGFFTQTVLCTWRAILQLKHSIRSFVLACGMFLFSGVYLGLSFIDPLYVFPVSPEVQEQCPYMLKDLTCRSFQPFCSSCLPLEDRIGLVCLCLCMGLGGVSAAIAVRTFGDERAVYWREASSGVSRLAYYCAKNILDSIILLFYTASFAASYRFISSPGSTYGRFFVLVYMLCWVVFAIGYMVSMMFSPANSSLVATLICVIISILCGYIGLPIDDGYYAFYPFWFSEGLYTAEIWSLLHNNMNATEVDLRSNALSWGKQRYYYTLDRFPTDLLAMLSIGMLLRVIVYFLLRFTHLAKQR